MNKLANEKSPYLSHAAEQKINWYPWSEEAFAAAKAADKPVFLSSGAVWCHWCHVMAEESFDDEEIAAILNEHFISIKLDRDERPDIDRRYQHAVAAMGGTGGWPLSVFLTPDKEPFFGGTYFPPRDVQNMPGFKKVLKAVNDFYRQKKSDAQSYANRVMDAIKPASIPPRDITQALLVEAEQSMLSHFDQNNGGFGTAPKFSSPGAIEFLLRRFARTQNPLLGHMARKTLETMAKRGIYDQLGGGFHRYATDEAWIIPHFEKMADDNAGLLKNYVDAYALFGDEQFRDIARGIISFTREVLSDSDGGFYASQDADVTPEDEGGYFTWTEEECKGVLAEDEYKALSAHLLSARGAMHHDPQRYVLSISQQPEVISKRLGKTVDEINQIIARGKGKLLSRRNEREAPFIDTSLYTSLNGMMISAYFHAFNVLRDEELREFGVKSLERILRERFLDNTLFHTRGVPAVLDDYVQLIDALLGAYEATAEQRYAGLADQLMALCMERFYDETAGGFFDTEHAVLGMRLKRIDDVPHASVNAVAVTLLLKLSLITGKEAYEHATEQSLRLFAEQARGLGIHGGAYFSALESWFSMLRLTVEAAPDSALSRSARVVTAAVPTTLIYGEDRNRVIPCKQKKCFDSITDPVTLKDICLQLQW